MKTQRLRTSVMWLGGLIWFLAVWAGFGATTNVTFGNYFFSPKSVTINVGDTVVWTRSGLGSHTVTGTGADPICGAGIVANSCSRTFNQRGTFPYVCTIFGHAAAGMTGVVMVVQATVTPATLSAPTRHPDGRFEFNVATTAGRTNIVEASTNLSTWLGIGTNVPGSGTFNFIDTNAGALNRRFYRVAQP